MKWIGLVVLGAAIMLAAPEPAKAQSYSCAKARLATEKAICRNRTLGQMDSKMAALYYGAIGQIPRGLRGKARSAQRKWLASRNQCGRNRACIRTHYVKWFAEYKKQASKFQTASAHGALAPKHKTYGKKHRTYGKKHRTYGKKHRRGKRVAGYVAYSAKRTGKRGCSGGGVRAALCASPQLRRMHAKMTRLYAVARRKVPASHRGKLYRAQAKWTASRNRCGANRSCLSKHYRKWFAEYRKHAAKL